MYILIVSRVVWRGVWEAEGRGTFLRAGHARGAEEGGVEQADRRQHQLVRAPVRPRRPWRFSAAENPDHVLLVWIPSAGL